MSKKKSIYDKEVRNHEWRHLYHKGKIVGTIEFFDRPFVPTETDVEEASPEDVTKMIEKLYSELNIINEDN